MVTIFFFLTFHRQFFFSFFYTVTMTDNIEIQDAKNSDEWINWIEEAIDKEYFKYYEYKNFSNIQEIGTGGFGKVFRANWRNNLEQYLVLKSFLNLNSIAVKEIGRGNYEILCILLGTLKTIICATEAKDLKEKK